MFRKVKLRWIILAGVSLVLAAVLVRLQMLPAEPFYHGLPLSDYLPGRPTVSEWKTQEALQAMAPKAIPFLLSMFDAQDSALRAFLARWSRKQTAFKIHFKNQQAYEARARASHGLALLGTNASSAVPQLARLLKRPECTTDATYALIHIGTPEALNALRSALHESDVQIRQALAWGLEVAGGRTTPLMPDLIRHFEDTNAIVRENVIRAVARAHEIPDEVVLLLAGKLADPSPAVSRAAATVLGGMNERARIALPAFTNALATADATTRPALLRAVQIIDPPSSCP